MSGTRIRGTVVGLVTAAGAAWGHQWAGGTVTPAALGIAVLVSVGLGVALVRPGRLPLPRLVLAAAAVQALWHLLYDAAGHDHAMAAAPGPGQMLAVHALVAGLTVALCAGADAALLDLARDALRRPPAPHRAPLRPYAPRPTSAVPARIARRTVDVVAARGPPRAASLAPVRCAPTQ